MLKVLAAVLAVLSAVISVTLYSTTIPAIQKQSEDNAAAIEQNAEDIDQIQSAVENIPEEKNLYLHRISFSIVGYTSICIFNLYSNISTKFSELSDFDYLFTDPTQSNYISVSGYIRVSSITYSVYAMKRTIAGSPATYSNTYTLFYSNDEHVDIPNDLPIQDYTPIKIL